MDISSLNSQFGAASVKSTQIDAAPAPRSVGSGRQQAEQAAEVGIQGSASQSAESSQKLKADAGDVKKALEELNNFVKQVNSDVRFSIDDETGIRIVKVIDRQTKDVIRQIPSEEAVEMAKAIDKFQGILIKQTA